MKFNDHPISDLNSIRCEQSEIAFKKFFNKRSGFVCRTDVPDYGCDYDIELIKEEKKITNWRIPVQLKSSQALTIIENGSYISFNIDCSRIGYLMRRLPALGLIILYDIESDKLYYDFVDQIYKRLNEQKGSEKWKEQDSVSIHIPVSNEVRHNELPIIHQRLFLCYQEAVRMYRSHSPKYGLPEINSDVPGDYDFNNPDDIEKFIDNHGIALVNDQDFEILLPLVKQLPHNRIYPNKTLLLVSLTTYCEAGMHTESSYLCGRIKRHNLTESETMMFQFVYLKNQLSLGEIDYKQFLLHIADLEGRVEDEENRLLLLINQTFYTIAVKKPLEVITSAFIDHVSSIFSIIEQGSIDDRKKALFTLWHADNLGLLASTIHGNFLAKNAFHQVGKGAKILEEQHQKVNLLKSLQRIFNQKVFLIQNESARSKDKLIRANSLTVEIRFFLNSYVNFFTYDIPVDKEPGFLQKISRMIANCGVAFKLFDDSGRPKQAYECLCYMIELIELAVNGYGLPVRNETHELHETKEKIETELELAPYQFIIREAIERKKKFAQGTEGKGIPALKNCTDEQIESIADGMVDGLSLKDEYRVNIINELKAYREFHKRNRNDNLLIRKIAFSNDVYSAPTQFILTNTIDGNETPPGTDINKLLEVFGS